MSKIKERERRKAALSDRKSAAAQARMKNIASLAADDRVPKKKRKAGAGGSHFAVGLSTTADLFCAEDMFGADDEDWAIYRKIVHIFSFQFSPSFLLTPFATEYDRAIFRRRR